MIDPLSPYNGRIEIPYKRFQDDIDDNVSVVSNDEWQRCHRNCAEAGPISVAVFRRPRFRRAGAIGIRRRRLTLYAYDGTRN